MRRDSPLVISQLILHCLSERTGTQANEELKGDMMSLCIPYKKKEAPIIGFVMVTLESEFDKMLKEKVKRRYRAIFNNFIREGYLDKNSMFFGDCLDEKDVSKVCETMTGKRVDGIIYHPLTWPAGETVATLATYRYLKDIPIFVSASPEIFPEGENLPYSWPQNSDCGKIFANSIFHKLDRKTLWTTGLPEEEEYQKELIDFFTICQLVRRAKKAKIAIIGNILDDFPESFYNPLTVRRELGVRVLEIDSSVLFSLFENGEYRARGLKIDLKEIEEEIKNLKENLQIRVEEQVLRKATRVYLAYKEIIKSVGAEGAVFRCALEWQEKYGLVICGVMAELIDNDIICSGGCEGDVYNTITGLLQCYASGKPTICLDWIDKPGKFRKGIYTLLHCGNACKGMLIPGKGIVDYHQAWTDKPLGYTIEGPIKKGDVTLARLRENRQGRIELLIIEAESVAEEMQIRGNYGLIHVGGERLRKLEYELNENGWPHHVSLGWGHHGDILQKASKFLGDIRVVRI